MSEAINIIDLIGSLPSRPRGRACIVLTEDYKTQKDWAEEVANQVGCEHLSLIEYFANNTELSSQIDTFGVAEILSMIKNQSSAEVLIVSGIEFLKATWVGDPDSSETLASHIENWSGTPCLVLVTQYDSYLAGREFRRHRQYKFVIDQKDTLKVI